MKKWIKLFKKRWAYKPESGTIRTYFHFMPVSVPAFVTFICFLLYIQSAYTFLAEKNIISKVSIYDNLTSPTRQLVGAGMFLALGFSFRYPTLTAIFIVMTACSLRGLDSIHLHSYAALTVYIPFLLVAVPLMIQSIRR